VALGPRDSRRSGGLARRLLAAYSWLSPIGLLAGLTAGFALFRARHYGSASPDYRGGYTEPFYLIAKHWPPTGTIYVTENYALVARIAAWLFLLWLAATLAWMIALAVKALRRQLGRR
jgi:hypothetical protein